MNTQGAHETDGGGWSKITAYEISALERTLLISCILIVVQGREKSPTTNVFMKGAIASVTGAKRNFVQIATRSELR